MDEDESEGNRLVEQWRAAKDDREREEAFERIFVRYHPVLVYFFQNRNCPREQAEDLAQEVWVRVFKSLGDFRGDSRFETWLFQIAANLFRNMVRERHALKRLGKELPIDTMYDSVTAMADPFESREPQPLETMMEQERACKLREAIQKLPAQMRRCVWLRVEAFLRYREIADVMRVSIDTVKAHLFQARQKLRSELGEYFADLEFQ